MDNEHYIKIYKSEYTKIECNSITVLGLIRSLSNDKGYCYMTNRKFAELLNTSEKTIQRHISKLKEKGLITVKGIKPRKIFISNGSNNIDKSVHNIGKQGQICPYNKDKSVHTTRTNLSTNNNKDNINYNYNNSQSKKTSYDIDELMKIK